MPLSTSAPTAVLTASRVSKTRGTAQVLAGVDLLIGPDQRLGILGPNGVGKTTLLRIIAGLEPADSGRVSVSPPTATIGYLAQEPEVNPHETLRHLLLRRTGVGPAEAALEAAAGALADGGPAAAEEYSSALDRYLALGAPDIEARMATVLDDLGLPERLLDVPSSGLSGGQRSRSALAALLLSRFDLLL